MKEDRESVRRLTGDGLSVQMDSNNRVLEVMGDGCKITLTKNCGSVRIVGDGCRVKVIHNVGDIVYTGDGGSVLLGPKSSKERVQYNGVGGKICYDCESMKVNSNVKLDTKKTVLLKNCFKMDKEKKAKNVDNCDPRNETKETKKVHVKNCNLRNEIQEKANCKFQDDQREMKNVKPSGTVFTTTTTTTTATTNNSGDLFEVNKWFASPASVVRSFVDNVPTVTVYKKRVSRNSTKK